MENIFFSQGIPFFGTKFMAWYMLIYYKLKKTVMKTITTTKKIMAVATLLCAMNVNAQSVIWSEDFGMSNAGGDKNRLLEEFNSSNGQWSTDSQVQNGANSNKWYVSATEIGGTPGACQKQFTVGIGPQSNCLHISNNIVRTVAHTEVNSLGDMGAIYSLGSESETDFTAYTPPINCTNFESLRLSFDYFCGARPGAAAEIWISGAGAPEMLDRIRPTKSGICDAYRKMEWKSSLVYTLPAAYNNLERFKIGFRWVNDSVTSTDVLGDAQNPGLVGQFVSIAIDNIVLTGTDVSNLGGGVGSARASNSKMITATASSKQNESSISFTTNYEKAPAQDLIIERSTDGTTFVDIDKVVSKAVKGKVNTLSYTYNDAAAKEGANYYRVKQVVEKNVVAKSKVVSTNFIKEKNVKFTVYPNPNSGQFTIDFSGIENNHEVQIFLNDMNDGHEVYTTSFMSNSIDSNKMDINPPGKITPGRYICSLVCEGIKMSLIVVIQ